MQAFAAGLFRRRRVPRARAGAPARVFLVHRRLPRPQPVTHRHHVTRIAVTLRAATQRVTMISRGAAVSRAHFNAPVPTAREAEPVIVRCATHEVQQHSTVVQRILGRSARRESAPHATTTAHPSPPEAPRIPRVVRAQPAPSPTSLPDRPDPASSAGWGEPTRAMRLPASAELSPDQIGRLTQQVMMSIDRRLLAHRERTGRI